MVKLFTPSAGLKLAKGMHGEMHEYKIYNFTSDVSITFKIEVDE